MEYMSVFAMAILGDQDGMNELRPHRSKPLAIAAFISTLLLATSLFGEVITYNWNTWSDGCEMGWKRTSDCGDIMSTCDYPTYEYLRCSIMTSSYCTSSTFHFYLLWLTGLRAGDSVSVLARIGNYAGGTCFMSGLWNDSSNDINAIASTCFQVSEGHIDNGFKLLSASVVVPGDHDGLVLCMGKTIGYDTYGSVLVDYMTVDVPDHATLICPNGVVPSVSDSWGEIKLLYR